MRKGYQAAAKVVQMDLALKVGRTVRRTAQFVGYDEHSVEWVFWLVELFFEDLKADQTEKEVG